MLSLKKSFLLLALAMPMTFFAQQRWGSPFTFGAEYHGEATYGCYFLPGGKGWVTGEAGIIMHTTDGGGSWELQNVPTNQNLFNVYFLNDTAGWAMGNGGTLLHTTDGGETWATQAINTTQPLTSMTFINQDTGWVVGSNVIGRTTNGGQTWQRQITTMNARKIIMLPGGMGWIFANSGIFQTLDTGKTWTQFFLNPNDYITDMSFYDSLNGWAAGTAFPKRIYKTSNGGQTWTPTNTVYSSSLHNIQRMMVESASTAWAIAGPSTTSLNTYLIFTTTDGGLTWNQAYSSDNIIQCLCAKSNTFGVAAGIRGFMARASNGFGPWTPLTQQLPSDINHVHFLPSGKGWISAEDKLYQSTNKGLDWTNIYTDPNHVIEDVFFSSDSIGYSYFYNYSSNLKAVRKSIDGGLSWQTIFDTTNSQFSFGDVFFVNNNVGWVSGSKGWLMKTSDGGQTWTKQTSNTTDGVMFMDFESPTLGWFADTDDEVFRTTDGGTTWILLGEMPGQDKIIRDMDFISPTHGWIVASRHYAAGPSTLYQTTNGGQTWTAKLSTPTSSWFNSVCFVSLNMGFVAGTGGTMFMTTDGGQNWVSQKSHTNGYLQRVRPVSSGSAIAIGSMFNVIIYNCAAHVLAAAEQTRCDAGQLNLSASTTAGTPVWYDSPNATAPVFTGQTYTTPFLISSQEYWVETSNQGCTSARKSVKATIVLENNTILQSNDSLIASAVNVNYQWYDCDAQQIIPGATNRAYIPQANGNYAVILSKNGCADTSACITVSNVSISESDKTIRGLSVYPNPARDVLVVSTGEAIQEIEIFDLLGKQLFSAVVSGNQVSCEVDLSGIQPALYIIRVRTAGGTYSELISKVE